MPYLAPVGSWMMVAMFSLLIVWGSVGTTIDAMIRNVWKPSYFHCWRFPNVSNISPRNWGTIPTDEHFFSREVKPLASYFYHVFDVMYERSSCFRSLLLYTMQIYILEVSTVYFHSVSRYLFCWKKTSKNPTCWSGLELSVRKAPAI